VCCAHEYTLSNLRFALAVEPHNPDLLAYHERCQLWRANGQPTLPSTLTQELAINPFMRSRQTSVVQAVQHRSPSASDEVAVFAQLREWKNQF
jgi:hydroxyacylglutathione hydrolase